MADSTISTPENADSPAEVTETTAPESPIQADSTTEAPVAQPDEASQPVEDAADASEVAAEAEPVAESTAAPAPEPLETLKPEASAASEPASVMAPATTWQPPTSTPRKRRRLIRRCILAALVAAYAAGGWFFSTHFTPRTMVDGVDASLMTSEQLSTALFTRSLTYEQHITGENGYDLTVKGSDMGLSFDGTKVAEEALARTTPALWLPSIFTPQNMLIDGNVTLDEEALSGIIQKATEAYNAEAEPPTNAKAHYDEESQQFVIDNEAVGTALDAAKISEQSAVAAKALKGDVILDDSTLLQPAITHENDELVGAVKQANAALDLPLEVQADGKTIATIDRKLMATWMAVKDDQKLDIFGVYKWIEDNPALIDAGNEDDDEHVWELDKQATCDAIHEAMDNLTGGPVEIVRNCIETKPPVTPGAKERGRHIDINLTTQYVRFYDSDGKVIWESYCVTGGWDWEYQEMHYTPTGTFAIQTKETNRVLVGADRNGDNKPDYESFVYYWMPFLNYDYGMHDATWRYDDGFGGDVYTYYGSHGCVNLPYAKAEELFGLVNVGDPVYIHYSDDNGASWYGGNTSEDEGTSTEEQPAEEQTTEETSSEDAAVETDESTETGENIATETEGEGSSEEGSESSEGSEDASSDEGASEGGHSEEGEPVDYSGDESYNGA